MGKGRHCKPRKPLFERKQRDRLIHPKLVDAQFKKLLGTVVGVFAFLAIMGTMFAPQTTQNILARVDPEPQQDDLLADTVLPAEVYTARRPVRPVAQITRDIERTQPIAIVKYPARDKEEKADGKQQVRSSAERVRKEVRNRHDRNETIDPPKHYTPRHRGTDDCPPGADRGRERGQHSRDEGSVDRDDRSGDKDHGERDERGSSRDRDRGDSGQRSDVRDRGRD